MANERKVSLAVRAKDEFSGPLSALEKAQQRIIEKNREIAKRPPNELKRFYGETKREIQSTEQQIRAVREEIDRLSTAEGNNRRQVAAREREQKKLQAQARDLRAAYQGVREEAQRMTADNRSRVTGVAANIRLMEREAAAAQRRAQVQERLNSQAKSGFANWSRYADTITRLAAQEERAQAIKARKVDIQSRLNAQATSGFAAWSKSADGLNRNAAAARNAATQLNVLAKAQTRVASTIPVAGGAGRGATGQRGRGDSGGRRGENQDVEIYGLRPYQMVNLGYQVNDVIGGLAMGQAPMQVFAQQIGQIIQIWPNMMVGLVRGLPVLAGTAAALTPVIVALTRLRTEANSLKLFDTNLRLLADGGRYSAETLSELTTQLSRAGVAIDDARAGVLAMVKEGFSQAQISAIGNLSRELSKVSGKTFTEEVTRLSAAFGGNAESVRELDKDLQFLTAEQLSNINALEQQGRKTEALAVAQDALAQKLRLAKGEMTPMQRAAEDLSTAWNTLLEVITQSSWFEDLVEGLAKDAENLAAIAGQIEAVSARLRRATEPTSADRYESLTARRDGLLAERNALTSDTSIGGLFLDDQLEGVNAALAAVNAELVEMRGNMAENARFMRNSEESAGDMLTVTEEEQKLRIDLGLALEAQLELLRQQAEQAGETAREEFIRTQQIEAQNQAKQRSIELTAEELELLRQQAGATFDARNSPVATGNYGSIVDRIVGVESGGNPNAKNPQSSATGLGQFIESTWLKMFKQYFPDRAAGMTNAAILAMRTDAAMSRQMVELYARENAQVLQAAGLAVTDASVYLAHFLGPGGAKALLSATPDTPTSQILGQDQISANQSILQGKTAADVLAWAERKMAVTDAEVEGNQRLLQLDQQRAKEQADYVTGYQKRLADQQFELELMAQGAREAAIAKALRDEELKAQEAGVALTEAQRDAITATAGALFDRQNAETRVNELMERRNELAKSLQIAQQAGDRDAVSQVVAQITETEAELQVAIDAAIAFYQALGGPAADAAILKLQNVKAAVGQVTDDMRTKFLPTAEDLNTQLSAVGADAFSDFAQAIAEGTENWETFRDAIRNGIGQMLIDLGRLIIQQMIFNAISGGMGGGGGVGGAIAQGIGSLFGARHGGGLVGNAAPTRMVNPAVFANAQRHHSGGLVGSEVPIIALKEEEVLTRDDPRHVKNGGGAGGGVNIKNVNLFDSAELLENALASEPGQQVLLNFMSRNAAAISAATSK